ncbi:unannotated protein [freshwater metagenome]|uniref:Unannotated protein n=1 Tax=freshwater metagenome TaxID=449393 RepID=A0A6J6HW89_9ZZZZ
MFDRAARPVLNAKSGLAYAPAEQVCHFAVVACLDQNCRAVRGQFESAIFGAPDDQAAVARHGFDDVGAHRGWYRELRVAIENSKNEIGVVTGGTRIPEAKFCNSVGVNVLGSTLELSKNGQIVSGINRIGVINLKQSGLVALNNQWSSHPFSLVSCADIQNLGQF